MRAQITRSSAIHRSGRVLQMEGMFDVAPSQKSEVHWQIDPPIEEKSWNVGLVLGPSGCGKSKLARELFGQAIVNGFDWPADRSIVDAFPAATPIKDITMLLSSVGFS